MDESQLCQRRNPRTGLCEQPKFLGRSYEADDPLLLQKKIGELRSQIKAYDIVMKAKAVDEPVIMDDTYTRVWSVARYGNRLLTFESGGTGNAWTDIYESRELYDRMKELYPPKKRY